jgi:SAM-dependent methyltransferase
MSEYEEQILSYLRKEGMSWCLSLYDYGQKRQKKIADCFLGKEGYFLDVGCNRGELKDFLESDFQYFGTDFRENCFKYFILTDFNRTNLPFKDESFDAVNCSAVMEHLFYPLDLLSEIKRVLKDNGIAVISLPNDKGLNSRYYYLFGKIDDFDNSVFGHHWRFNIKTARSFVEKEFEIIREWPEFGPIYSRFFFFLKFKLLCTEWFMVCKKRFERK